MCFDVLEHLDPKDSELFFSKCKSYLNEDGIFICRIPSLESQVYASESNKNSHINCMEFTDFINLAKKSFKSKSHNRQSQIINLIHQRVRAAYKNAKDPATKKRLKRAFDYAKERKEASKKKTERLKKKKNESILYKLTFENYLED